MLAVVLTVLKIIGIILLCLLLAILVIIGLLLFVPVRYRGSGYYHEDYAVKGRISWLFHLISIKLLLQKEQDLQLVVRVLGIPVYDMQKKKNKAAKKDEKKSKDKNKNKNEKKAKKAAKQKHEAAHDEEIQIVKPPVPHRPGTEEQKSVLSETVNPDREKHKTYDFVNKCRILWEKCKQSILNIRYTITRICDKIKTIKDNITYYMELLQEENTKLAFAACKKELLRIWKDIKPKRFKVNVLLGMEDPATTGQIVGYCAMLYPLHQGNITVVPEFEDKVFQFDFSLKGKMTVYVYLIVAYTIFFNKNIMHLKKCLLREDS